MYKSGQQDRPPPRDYRAEVTADIIKMLEEGTAPWQKPWDAGELGRSPFNPTTNKPYRGGNVLGLMIAGMRKGYTDPRWMTYKQAADNGWQVRKGEKSTAIEFCEVGRGKDDEGESDADKPRSRMIHRVYSVFNAQQIDGIPKLELPARKPFEAIEAGENMLSHSGADIRHGGAKAYYSPKSDHIQMPEKECFVDEPHYYATAQREIERQGKALADYKAQADRPFEHAARLKAFALRVNAEPGDSLFVRADTEIAAKVNQWIRSSREEECQRRAFGESTAEETFNATLNSENSTV